MQIVDFKNQTEVARNGFLQKQKEIVRNEIEKVVDYVNDTRMFIEEKMKNDLHEKTIQSWLIIDNIYRSNIGKRSTEQLIEMVKDALRPIRFFNGRGYYFMVRMDGTELLYPVSPEFEGKNLLDLRDERGSWVIKP
jgi:signal transduction histidine kinase